MNQIIINNKNNKPEIGYEIFLNRPISSFTLGNGKLRIGMEHISDMKLEVYYKNDKDLKWYAFNSKYLVLQNYQPKEQGTLFFNASFNLPYFCRYIAIRVLDFNGNHFEKEFELELNYDISVLEPA